MVEPIHEIESNILMRRKQNSADYLIEFITSHEMNSTRGRYSTDDFFQFNKYFRQLMMTTAHEKSIQEVKYGSRKLIDLVNHYFNSGITNNPDFGIKIARAYLKACFEKGVLSMGG